MRFFTKSNVILPAAPSLLSILTVAYEMLTAVCTTVRTVQELTFGGSWWAQQKTLTFLVLREGQHHYTHCFLLVLTHNLSALGLLYFA